MVFRWTNRKKRRCNHEMSFVSFPENYDMRVPGILINTWPVRNASMTYSESTKAGNLSFLPRSPHFFHCCTHHERACHLVLSAIVRLCAGLPPGFYWGTRLLVDFVPHQPSAALTRVTGCSIDSCSRDVTVARRFGADLLRAVAQRQALPRPVSADQRDHDRRHRRAVARARRGRLGRVPLRGASGLCVCVL